MLMVVPINESKPCTSAERSKESLPRKTVLLLMFKQEIPIAKSLSVYLIPVNVGISLDFCISSFILTEEKNFYLFQIRVQSRRQPVLCNNYFSVQKFSVVSNVYFLRLKYKTFYKNDRLNFNKLYLLLYFLLNENFAIC